MCTCQTEAVECFSSCLLVLGIAGIEHRPGTVGIGERTGEERIVGVRIVGVRIGEVHIAGVGIDIAHCLSIVEVDHPLETGIVGPFVGRSYDSNLHQIKFSSISSLLNCLSLHRPLTSC